MEAYTQDHFSFSTIALEQQWMSNHSLAFTEPTNTFR